MKKRIKGMSTEEVLALPAEELDALDYTQSVHAHDVMSHHVDQLRAAGIGPKDYAFELLLSAYRSECETRRKTMTRFRQWKAKLDLGVLLSAEEQKGLADVGAMSERILSLGAVLNLLVQKHAKQEKQRASKTSAAKRSAKR